MSEPVRINVKSVAEQKNEKIFMHLQKRDNLELYAHIKK